MPTFDQVAQWLRTNYPEWLHVEDRISDVGFAFLLNTQPDAYLDGDKSAMTFGNGPGYVLKRTGAAWFLPSTPDVLAVYDARTERAFRKRMRKAGMKVDKPHFVIPQS